MSAITITKMQAADVLDVLRIQSQSFTPDLIEDDAVMRHRFDTFGEHCFVARKDERVLGYCLSFPWTKGDILPHNTPAGAVDAPDCFYLQDISIAPDARGQGLAGLMLCALYAHASDLGFTSISLVAVEQSGSYWDAQGFVEATDIAPEKLAYIKDNYGQGARLMMRPL